MANRLISSETNTPVCVDVGPRSWTIIESQGFDDLLLTRCAVLPGDATGVALAALRAANLRETGRTPFSVGRYRDCLLLSTRLPRAQGTPASITAARGDLLRFEQRCMRAGQASLA